MRRRDFITALGTAATWPLAVRAQQPARMQRIAFVHPFAKVSEMNVSNQTYQRAFFEELIRLGYIEGQNLGVERYSGEGQSERYAELVRNVVNTHPDVIVTLGARLSLDFKVATTTIPIVTIMFDPVAQGLVTSIARPGGNIQASPSPGDSRSSENAWDCWSRRCQNCPASVTLHRDHTGKIYEVRQRERRPKGWAFR